MGFVDVEGGRLHFEERGSGSPVLLLHGFTLDWRIWAPQMDALSDRFRVIAWDARGFGKSDVPTGPYRHCDDIALLCERLGISRAVFVGHSIGAHQVLELALTRPALVAGIVGVAASGLGGIPFPNDVQALFGAVRTAAQTSVEEAKKLWATSGWFAPARKRPELAATLDEILADYSGWHWTHDNPFQSVVPPPAERLHEIAVPVSVVVGRDDIPYNQVVADALASKIRNATKTVLDGGHMASLEDPNGISKAIAAVVSASGAR